MLRLNIIQLLFAVFCTCHVLYIILSTNSKSDVCVGQMYDTYNILAASGIVVYFIFSIKEGDV